jgi:hypothetical protein
VGLDSGEESEAFNGKTRYIRKRISDKSTDILLAIAKKLLERYPYTEDLEDLLKEFPLLQAIDERDQALQPISVAGESPIIKQHLEDNREVIAEHQELLNAHCRTLGPIRNRWALLVGVNRYIDTAVPRLSYCVADVQAMQHALEPLDYTVVAMHDALDRDNERFPTRANVEAELTKLCQVAQPDDLLLLFFACHGRRVGERPLLLLHDTRLLTLARTGLALDEIETHICNVARCRVMLLDACNAGGDGQRALPDTEFIRHVYEQARGFALIAASTAQQQAHEQPGLGHGVFTHFVLEGLGGAADRNGKRFVTVNDLSVHVLDALRRWSMTAGGALQEPTARTETVGDIILADHRGRPRAAGAVLPNPFGKTGCISDPGDFYDRTDLLRRIFEELGKGINLSLVGPSQIGKSSLLAMICLHGPERLRMPPQAFITLNLQQIENEDEFYEALCEALGIDMCRGYPLVRALRGRRCIVCLDEIEVINEEGFTIRVRRQLRGLADGAGAPLTLVIASRSPLAHLFPDSPERDSPLAGVCRQIDVGPFPPAVARAFLAERLDGTGISFTDAQIDSLLKASGGHPARLQDEAAHLYRALVEGGS